jgi:hypothetical protein
LGFDVAELFVFGEVVGEGFDGAGKFNLEDVEGGHVVRVRLPVDRVDGVIQEVVGKGNLKIGIWI